MGSPRAYIWKTILDLKLQKNGVDFFGGCGFPERYLHKILAELKSHRIAVVIVRETGRELYKAKERVPYMILEFTEA